MKKYGDKTNSTNLCNFSYWEYIFNVLLLHFFVITIVAFFFLCLISETITENLLYSAQPCSHSLLKCKCMTIDTFTHKFVCFDCFDCERENKILYTTHHPDVFRNSTIYVIFTCLQDIMVIMVFCFFRLVDFFVFCVAVPTLAPE